METSQPLTIESFSYSWLIDGKSPSSNVNDHGDYNEEENGNSIVNSQRFLDESLNFHFDLPFSAPNLVHADEIFFKGYIIPKSVNQIRLCSSPTTPVVHFFPSTRSKSRKRYGRFIVNWRISSKRILKKCFSFFIPRKNAKVVDSSRKSVCSSTPVLINEQMGERVEVYETTLRKAKSWSHTSTCGSRSSCSNDDLCGYNERSVHEAVLHCKRSFEN